MEKIMAKFQDKLMSLSVKFAQSVVLSIISSAFMMIMPITIVGSIASLLRGIDFGGYQVWIQSNGLYNLFGILYQFTIGFLAVFIVFCVAYQYASKHGMSIQAITIGLTALIAFFVITPYTPAESLYGSATIPTDWLGATGMFMAIVVGFLVGWVYEFCHKKHIAIKLPEQVPPTIARQFSALIPAFIILFSFLFINWSFSKTPFGNAQSALYAIIQIPLGLASANLFGMIVLTIFCYMLWFFGIHGGLAVMPIMMVLFTPIQMENLAAFQAGQELPHMITGSYISIGSGSLPLVVAMLIWSKSKANRSITKIAIIPSLFGVDEPAYFGLPMIMNPIFFIPWVVLTPLVCICGTYLLQSLGLVGYFTGASAGGFVPFFVSNLVGYGVSGMIWGFVLFGICVALYLPFMKVYDKQCCQKEENGEEVE